MHLIVGLVFFAAVLAVLMRLPLKVALIVLGVCALVWILAPGPLFAPGMGFGPGLGHGFGHGLGHGFGPLFGMGPRGGIVMIVLGAAVIGAVVWLAMRMTKGGRTARIENPQQSAAQTEENHPATPAS